MGSCICSSRLHGEDTVATKCKMEIIGDELIISKTNGHSEEKRHPLWNLVAASFEGEILWFKDSRVQTTHEYILPTEGDAKDMMTCIMKSITDNDTRLDAPSDLSKIDYTVMNFIHRAQQWFDFSCITASSAYQYHAYNCSLMYRLGTLVSTELYHNYTSTLYMVNGSIIKTNNRFSRFSAIKQ